MINKYSIVCNILEDLGFCPLDFDITERTWETRSTIWKFVKDNYKIDINTCKGYILYDLLGYTIDELKEPVTCLKELYWTQLYFLSGYSISTIRERTEILNQVCLEFGIEKIGIELRGSLSRTQYLLRCFREFNWIPCEFETKKIILKKENRID